MPVAEPLKQILKGKKIDLKIPTTVEPVEGDHPREWGTLTLRAATQSSLTLNKSSLVKGGGLQVIF